MRPGDISRKKVAARLKGLSTADRDKAIQEILATQPNGPGTEATDFIRTIQSGVKGEEAIKAVIQEELDRQPTKPGMTGPWQTIQPTAEQRNLSCPAYVGR